MLHPYVQRRARGEKVAGNRNKPFFAKVTTNERRGVILLGNAGKGNRFAITNLVSKKLGGGVRLDAGGKREEAGLLLFLFELLFRKCYN